MDFHRTLERLRDAARDHPESPYQRGVQPGKRLVGHRDLIDLLRQFDRMDAVDRMHYPPHIARLADAATIALQLLPPCTVADDLRYALHLVRPDQ